MQNLFSRIFPAKINHIFFKFDHGRDRNVAGFSTTCEISAFHHLVVGLNPVHGEVYLIQHYVIKFVNGFVRVLRFPPPIKLIVTI